MLTYIWRDLEYASDCTHIVKTSYTVPPELYFL